jgi:hypothetical protein
VLRFDGMTQSEFNAKKRWDETPEDEKEKIKQNANNARSFKIQ